MHEFSYYKINKLLWRWSKKHGASAIRDVKVSFDELPPALPVRPISKVAPAPKQPRQSPWDEMLDDFGKFGTWLSESLTRPTPSPQQKHANVPPFDIQRIPRAMRKERMPVGAKLMERWFAGRLNYSPTPADEVAEINQAGQHYPADMYDTTSIKLDWVLKFARAKEKYDVLIGEAVRSSAARKVMHDKLTTYKYETRLFASDLCGNDTRELHQRFQFQRVEVDGSFCEKLATQLRADIERFGVPDDLSAALGSFNIYAAIGSVRFSRDYLGGSEATKADVTGVWIYVKDNYTFTDQQGERSQYLGHWSTAGVIVVPLDEVASFSSYVPYVDSPVTVGNPVIEGEVYYPVHNSDFREWSRKHQRGGDFIIYSDRRFVPMVPPITLYL
ncbi:conserved hypothetical protein [Paraburkholderia sabiae]|uniref:DUF6402 family protein n=1 Tax=Paraburkholderia sabiae TaxID=273251 RepID=UPI001CB575A9|nr:DUF6402 family protein [Paraburkholderia sabiae]CAG9234766.1 conserved hypothetical protein [Paraburkholderia sabiae]